LICDFWLIGIKICDMDTLSLVELIVICDVLANCGLNELFEVQHIGQIGLSKTF